MRKTKFRPSPYQGSELCANCYNPFGLHLPSEECPEQPPAKQECEHETCTACEGSGAFWADGKAHYPFYTGKTVPCSACDGRGYRAISKPAPVVEVSGVLCAETDTDWSIGNVAVFAIYDKKVQEGLSKLQGQPVTITIRRDNGK